MCQSCPGPKIRCVQELTASISQNDIVTLMENAYLDTVQETIPSRKQQKCGFRPRCKNAFKMAKKEMQTAFKRQCEKAAEKGSPEEKEYKNAKVIHVKLDAKVKAHLMEHLAKRVQNSYSKLDLWGLKRALTEFQEGLVGNPSESIASIETIDETVCFSTQEILTTLTAYATELFSWEKIEEEAKGSADRHFGARPETPTHEDEVRTALTQLPGKESVGMD